LVKYLAERKAPHGGTLGLVINGDAIDVLAEETQGYVASPEDAEQAARQILDYPAFADIWQSLQDFTRSGLHQLIIVLGNHDLELAFPNVQELFLSRLAGTDEKRRGRIAFATSGAGYRCRVGHKDGGFASVLCVHGNELDNWNAVSPESIMRIVRAATYGRKSPLADEPPNAGTQLVKDVMNRIKGYWPFVDLLKPEVETVFNILLALDPKQASALGKVLAAIGKAETIGTYRVTRVLGAQPDEAAAAQAPAPSPWKPGKAFGAFLDSQATVNRDLLAAAWAETKEGHTSPEDLAGEQEQQVLGPGRVIANWFKYSWRSIFNEPMEAIRATLADWGGGQETWDLDGKCSVFDQLEKLPADLQPDVDVVVAGHTHLRRQKRLASGALYLNTGTWARLMRLTKECLDSKAQFAAVWNALKSMTALDALELDTNQPGQPAKRKVVLHQPTVAVLRTSPTSQGLAAAICEYTPANAADPFALVEHGAWNPVGRKS
jgi:hypothetical protein